MTATDDEAGRVAGVGEDTVEHPVTGERIRFLDDPDDPGRDPLRFAVSVRPGGGVVRPHVHPRQDEHLAVEVGQMVVQVGDDRRVIEAGESVTVPAGTPHDWKNADPDRPLRFVAELRPGLHAREAFEAVWSVPPDRLREDGSMELLQAVVTLDAHWGIFAYPTIPVAIQRVGVFVLARIGRLLGRRPSYERAASRP